uniref:Uncharacterized protein n=1 Tax=biofilter metagenome TaxID=1070537 RepID=A0A193SD00_9ZZZZ
MTAKKPNLLRSLISDLELNTAPAPMGAYAISKAFRPFSQSVHGRAARRGSTTGILLVQNLKCPQLNEQMLSTLSDVGPEFVTKYLSKEGYEHSLKGSFKFGTLAEYKKKEGDLSNRGRFGDEKESIQQHIFNSRSGYFERFKYSGLEIKNSHFLGLDNDVVIEFQANSYCACCSVGKYDAKSADALRNNGNPDITHFVTYNLSKLRSALNKIFSAEEKWNNSALIGRTILYGDKDRRWEIEESFTVDAQRDALGIFMGLAFVKDKTRFEHEDEYRLMIIDLNAMGALSSDAPSHAFIHESILEAITASGEAGK